MKSLRHDCKSDVSRNFLNMYLKWAPREWIRLCETHVCFEICRPFSLAVYVREKGRQFKKKHAFHRNESALIFS